MSNPSEILRELQAKFDAVKLQAQLWKQEAKTANATIAEIYQICTGGTGEPGNWNGAEPVRRALEGRPSLEITKGLPRKLRDDEYPAHESGAQAGAVQRPADEEPRFSLSIGDHGVHIWDESPTYDDASLRVSGNFDSFNQKIEFAREVLALLNCLEETQRSSSGARSDDQETGKEST